MWDNLATVRAMPLCDFHSGIYRPIKILRHCQDSAS
jgi:hypothetical protein